MKSMCVCVWGVGGGEGRDQELLYLEAKGTKEVSLRNPDSDSPISQQHWTQMHGRIWKGSLQGISPPLRWF